MDYTLFAFIGWTEILIVLGIILLLFGGSKIPKLMRGMGSGINEFKKGLKEGESEAQNTAGDSIQKIADQKKDQE